MDFLDPKKRRSYGIRLMLGYVLMAIALGIGTLILVMASSGYGFDRKTGEIIQNGLVFVNSHPTSSRIFINGEDRGGTDGRFVLEEGNYRFELRQDGYRSWKHDVNLEGAAVERLVYPFMFPTILKTADTQLYATPPTMTSQSPDRHWIVTHNVANLNVFQITDANTKENITSEITLPSSILKSRDTTSSKVVAVEWSTDNRHLLLRNEFDGGSEYILLDRESPSSSVNLNELLGRSYTQMTLRDKRFDQIYAWDANGGALQSVDLKTKAVTAIAQQVTSFFPYGNDTLLYTTTAGAETGKVIVKIRQGTTDYKLRTLPVSDRYLLNMASFNGDPYVIVGSTAESRGYLYRDPLASLKKIPPQLPPAKALLKVDGAQFVSFSANARFVAIQGAGKFAVYDLENNRQFRYDTGLQVTPDQKANWMDGHRLSLVSNGKLAIFDFDGTNLQTLTAVQGVYQPFFDRDYTALFTVSPSSTVTNKAALARTELIVKQ